MVVLLEEEDMVVVMVEEVLLLVRELLEMACVSRPTPPGLSLRRCE